MARGTLAIIGSGETAPGMTKVHRDLLARLDTVDAINLDTPYGFQENVPQLNAKHESYFDVSLHVPMETVHFPSYDDATDVERTLVKRRIRRANYVFAGPGSPSYALAQWRPLRVQEDFAAVLDAGGVVTIASAAALTLGAFTAPIYEIYKVGSTPQWLAGLDLLGRYGIHVAVIPHFDNAEGGNHDTRYCYLGARRLAYLESRLPPGTQVLGVDEHTALLLDFATDTATVRGRGAVHLVTAAGTTSFPSGPPIALDDLRTTEAAAWPAPRPASLDDSPAALAEIARRGGPDSLEALAALTELALQPRREEPRDGELIDELVLLRDERRAAGDYDAADQLRQLLDRHGVALGDGPAGTTWSRRP